MNRQLKHARLTWVGRSLSCLYGVDFLMDPVKGSGEEESVFLVGLSREIFSGM